MIELLIRELQPHDLTRITPPDEFPDTRFPAVPNRGELTAVGWCTSQTRTPGNRLLQQAMCARLLLEDLGRQGIR